MSINIPKVTKNDPLKRLPISVHTSTEANLAAYRAYYTQVHGDDISLSLLVEVILNQHLTNDKSFQKQLVSQKK